jgi:short-subunit dehydrogenase
MKSPYDVIVITGASSGIGRALALELAKLGGQIGLIARRINELDHLAKEINSSGGKAKIYSCDVSDRKDMLAAIQNIETGLGPIDLFIANAGISCHISAHAYDLDLIEKTYGVNLLGSLYGIQAVLPGMLSRKQGHIVGICSLASYRGMPLKGAYCGSKAALRLELESLRVELEPEGIAVTTICPGYIATPLVKKNSFKMPFLLPPDRAAELIKKAILRKRRIYKFPWQTVLLTILIRSAPNWMFDKWAGAFNAGQFMKSKKKE